MPIKLRILLFVLALEVLGYGLLLAYNATYAERALSELRAQQIHALLIGNLNRIQAQTGLIERNVLDLATVGETLRGLRHAHPDTDFEPSIRAHLIAHFRRFPFSIGGGLWYEPYVYDPARRLFGPYAYWKDGEVVFTWDLNTEQYDYPRQSWYLHALPEDWPRDRARPREVYWTEPYYDEAGTQALMMTADAPMYADGRIIGMATVDWSMEGMRDFVARIALTPGSRSFMIERQSGRFVSFVLDEAQVMRRASALPWGAQLLSRAEPGVVTELTGVEYGDQQYVVYAMGTDVGLVFGLLVPVDEVLGEIRPLVQQNVISGIVISLFFIATMTLALGVLFRPFNRVLALIGNSIRHRDDGELELTPLVYDSSNEFTPIVRALNEVYAEVRAYTHRLSDANANLSAQRSEIQQLNASLERKVEARTLELASKAQELSVSLAELRDTQQQLIEAEKHIALNQLVAGIAHEINTPLGIGVTACSHLAEQCRALQQAYVDGTMKRTQLEKFIEHSSEGFRIVQTNLERAAQLIRSFKQISVDQSSEAQRRFELSEYLNGIVLSLRPQLKRTPHTVVIDCPEGLTLDSYPGAVSQIVTNLIMNSLIHGFRDVERGTMTIDVTPTADGIRLVYADDGRGIPTDNLARIFEPFFTTNRAHGGSGLGLHVVFNLVTQQLRGRVQCTSEEGQGVRFTIDLPNLAAGDGAG